MAVERDLVWDAVLTVAERMSEEYEDTGLVVRGARRRSFRTLSVTEGLLATDKWTDVFEPVRRRRIFSSQWTEVEPIQEAAARVGTFLRERPDQR